MYKFKDIIIVNLYALVTYTHLSGMSSTIQELNQASGVRKAHYM